MQPVLAWRLLKKNSRNVLHRGSGMIISSLQLPNLAVSNYVFGCMYGASLEAQRIKNVPVMQEIWFQFPGSGGRPGGGNGNPFQYLSLKNSMDKGAWWATVHGVKKSQTWLND